MKKLLSLVFCMLLLVGTVSALDFAIDNYKNIINDGGYSKIEIWDEGQIGPDTKLATVELIDNTDYCINSCEANIKLTLSTTYSTPFNKLDFYNARTKDYSVSLSNSEILIRTSSYTDEEVIYKTICEGSYENKTPICSQVPEVKEVVKWNYELYKEQDLEAGEYYFKIKGKKKQGQTVEWIPTFLNFEVDEWATWNTTFNIGLFAYYNFSDIKNDANSTNYNLTVAQGTPTFTGTNALLGYSGLTSSNNNWNITEEDANFDMQYDGWTICQWVRPTSWGGAGTYMRPMRKGTDYYFEYYSDGTNSDLYFNVFAGTTASLHDTTDRAVGSWYHNCVVKNTSSYVLYVNGDEKAKTDTTTKPPAVATNLQLGESFDQVDWNGLMDEMGFWNVSLEPSMVLDLYNGGTGMTYVPAPGGDGVPITLRVNLTSPADNFNTNISYLEFTADFTVNGGNLTNATLYVWYSNGSLFNTNTTLMNGTLNGTSLFMTGLGLGTYDWNYYACAFNSTPTEICRFNETNLTFSYSATVDAKFFSLDAYETSQQFFQANISVPNGSTFHQAYFHYNYTKYLATTSTIVSGSSYKLEATIDVPPINETGLGNTTDENRPFHWEIQYSDDGITSTNMSSDYQNVSSIQLVLCNATYPDVTLNFTTRNESYPHGAISSKFSSTFNYWLGSGTQTKTYSFTDSVADGSEFAFCSNPNNHTMNADMSANYEAPFYDLRKYYLSAATLTNVSNKIELYLLNSTLSTSFLLDVNDANSLPLKSAIVKVQRYYPEDGSYKTIEMAKTDLNGQTTVQLLENDADYRFIVESGTSVLLTTPPQRVVCLSAPCTIELNVDSSIPGYKGIFDLDSSISYNYIINRTSGVVRLEFSDSSGTVTQARLSITQLKLGGEDVVICNTTATGASGVITCDLSAYSGQIRSDIYFRSSPEDLAKSIIDSLENITQYYGLTGLFLGMLLIVMIALVGVWDISVSLILLPFGLLMVWLLGLIDLSSATITYFIALMLIIIIGRSLKDG